MSVPSTWMSQPYQNTRLTPYRWESMNVRATKVAAVGPV